MAMYMMHLETSSKEGNYYTNSTIYYNLKKVHLPSTISYTHVLCVGVNAYKNQNTIWYHNNAFRSSRSSMETYKQNVNKCMQHKKYTYNSKY